MTLDRGSACLPVSSSVKKHHIRQSTQSSDRGAWHPAQHLVNNGDGYFQLLTVRSWLTVLPALSLKFLICDMEMIVSTSSEQDGGEGLGENAHQKWLQGW